MDFADHMKPLKVRELVLGDGIPKICVPIVAEDPESLKGILEQMKKQQELFDLVEFRADYYDFREPEEVQNIISKVREELPGKPFLFTFRTREEGGQKAVSFREYADLNKRAAEAGADLADLQYEFLQAEEGRGEEAFGLLASLQAAGTKVIGSFHDFLGTPSAEELVKKMAGMQMAGFDISKVAVMPRDREDVLELLFASVQMQEDWADRPYITMSMGEIGRVTRICGAFSGSCITFASLGRSSAPGQIDASALREVLRRL